MNLSSLLFLLPLGACAARLGYRSEAPLDPQARFRRFLAEVQLAWLDRDPALRERAGLPPREDWPETTERLVSIDEALTRSELERLPSFPRRALSADSRLSADLFAYAAERRLERLHWSELPYLAVPGSDPGAILRERLLEEAPWEGEAAAADWIDRAKSAAPWLQRMSRRMEARRDRGLLAPAGALTLVAAEARALVGSQGATASPLETAFRNRLDSLEELEPQTRDDLERRGLAVLQEELEPALEHWLSVVETLAKESPGDQGVWALQDGEPWYASRLFENTTLPLSARALHQVGLDETARLQDEVRAIMQQLDHPGDLAGFLHWLRDDPELQVGAELSSQSRSDDPWGSQVALLLPHLDAVYPHAREGRSFGLDEIRDDARAKAPTPLAAPDPSQRPRLQATVAVARALFGRTLRMRAQEDNSQLPAFRRTLDLPAWSEGWDLYASGLPLEMGMVEDPYAKLGILTEELWATGLLVVDTGIHGLRWSPEQGRTWLEANTGAEKSRIEAALVWVSTHPGRACAASIGCLRLREMRALARERLGEAFDLPAFHRLILAAGPLTLGMLEERVLAWEGAS